MTYNDLNVGTLYTYWDDTHYLIINKGTDEFEYCRYNSYDKTWAHKFSLSSDFKNRDLIWRNLGISSLRKSRKYSMIKNLFKNGIKK